MFLIKYAPNARRDTYRVAVVVSKKVHKSAVVRNRIRRRLYEVVRSFEQQITGAYDIVLTVHDPKLAELAADKLTVQVKKQLRSAGILPKEGV